MASERKTAIISGGCGGVGRAIGAQLAKDGFDIVALYFSTPRDAAETIVRNFGPGNHRAIACDIRDPQAVAGVIAEIIKASGEINACVHAAVDPILRKDVLEMTGEELTAQLGTGFFGGFHFLTQVARTMKQNGKPGTIIGILSPVADPGALYAHMSGYGVQKYALRGLLKELARELASNPITVNAVSPNFMDTKLNSDLPAAVRTFSLEHPPRTGMNTPEEVARAISFLVSENGKDMNGKIYSENSEEVRPL